MTIRADRFTEDSGDAFEVLSPGEQPEEVTEAIDGEIVAEKTPSGDVPRKLPTREELTAQVSAAMSELIEELRDAVVDGDKVKQKKITKEIDELQRSAGFASRILGMVGPFDPTLAGTMPHGKPGDAAVIQPEESDNGGS